MALGVSVCTHACTCPPAGYPFEEQDRSGFTPLCYLPSCCLHAGHQCTNRCKVPVMTSIQSLSALNINNTLRVHSDCTAASLACRFSQVTNYTMSHIHLANQSSNGAPIVLLLPMALATPLANNTLPNAAALPLFNPAIPYIQSMAYYATVTPSSLIGIGTKPMTWKQFMGNLTNGSICKFVWLSCCQVSWLLFVLHGP